MDSGTSARQRGKESSRSAQLPEVSSGGPECSLVSLRPFRTPQHQIIEYLSNATEPKQTTRSLSVAARRVSTNNHDRDKRDEIGPAVGQEG